MRHWIKAFRLRTLPLSLSCIIMGSTLASKNNHFSIDTFILLIITTTLLQILSNLANDYGDAIKGTDNDNRVGPERAIQSGKISRENMFLAIVINALLALGSGMYLIYNSLQEYSFLAILLFVFIGLASIAAAIKYTMGKNPYGYSGMGDFFVFIFFGLVGVIGSYFLFSKSIDYTILFPAFTIGLLSTAVLNMNNMRDIDNDRECNKNTLVVKMGSKKARTYHTLLILGAFFFFLITIINFNFNAYSLLALFPFIILFKNIKTTWNNKTPQLLDPELKKIALSTFSISLILAIVTIIERLIII